MESELQKRIEGNGMVISRIPKWAKASILSAAEVEHADDYGAAIAQFIREANEYRMLKSMFFDNQLNVQLLFNKEDDTQEVMGNLVKSEKPIKFANGKELNSNGGKNE